MAINLNGRVIADTRITGVTGAKLAGAYLMKLSFEFVSPVWSLSIPAPARPRKGPLGETPKAAASRLIKLSIRGWAKC